MKPRLITLLTMCRTLDGAKDRKGAYTLRHVNEFPKFRPAARAGAAGSPHAGHPAPSTQPSLFEAGKAPVVVAPAKDGADGKNGANGTNRSDRPDRADQPLLSRASKGCFRWFANAGACLLAAAAFLPKTAARAWGRLRSPVADSRPRAQGELALEKVTVLRNDLSDSDLVVVAVQPKAEDPRAAQPEAPEPAGNPWTRVTARWIKLKNPEEDGGPMSNVKAGQGRAGSPQPAAERRGGSPQSAGQWAQTPP